MQDRKSQIAGIAIGRDWAAGCRISPAHEDLHVLWRIANQVLNISGAAAVGQQFRAAEGHTEAQLQ